MTAEQSTWNAGTWITSVVNLILGLVAASAMLMFAGAVAASAWDGAAVTGAVSAGACSLGLAFTVVTSGHTRRVAITTFIVGAVVAAAFGLYLMFLFATGEISFGPDNVLGEPGSCFAGC
jgi:hypothetical protein